MSLLITSLQNIRVKDAVKLRDRRARERQDRIVVDGLRELERALHAGVEFVELFVAERSESGGGDERLERIVEKATAHGAAVLRCTDDVFAKLAYGERNEGAIGVARTPRRTLGDWKVDANPVLGVLVGVEKPGNVGAVLRSADGAGLSGVIVADGGTDLFNPNAIRSSLGAIFTVPVVSATSVEAERWLRQHDVQIFAARVDGAVRYSDVDYRGPTAFVLGCEATGLAEDAWSGPDVTNILLPMRGVADSLNVSITAAILFYEALRQRG